MPLTRSEIEQNITEQLLLLSDPGATPEGVRASTEALRVGDVSFENGSWRVIVEQAQGWMRLPREVNGETPEAFDLSLAEALAEDPVGVAGDALLERLSERLERAVALRDRFREGLEGTPEGRATLETATQQWVDAWEQVDDEEEAEVGGPITAKADVWSINDFVQRARDRELNLSPSYQRADVWPTGDAQLLIESVLRGIPLPSIILLQDDDGLAFEVVDGKQRLTSLLRFMGSHPHALDLVEEKSKDWQVANLVHTFQTDYPAFKKIWKQHEQVRLTAQTERENYFPFPLRSGKKHTLRGELAQLQGRFYSEIRDDQINVAGRKQRVRSVFEQASTYKIPVILYEEVTNEQIHEVFSLYNKQGKHLNAEEIRNARFHSLALMRGLLATAGDADEVAVVAPFLVEEWDDLASTSRTLDNHQYGFGRAGYKRTKLLSWVASVLFGEENSIGGRSTATTVNSLFERVTRQQRDPLRDESLVRDAMLLLDHGLDVHAAAPEAWAPNFKNPRSGGWQELQLVSTLIALSAAYAVLGEDLLDRLDLVAPDIAYATGNLWARPKKTQTVDQWRFTAGVVRGLLAILDVDPRDAQRVLEGRFGECGLESLLALSDPEHWKASSE